MAKTKKLPPDVSVVPNPLTSTVPAATNDMNVVSKANEPPVLAPEAEQTGRQDTMWNGVPFAGGLPGFPMVGMTPFYGSAPATGLLDTSPFYSGFGAIGLNGYGIPLGTFANYWLMERNPTVALAEAAADAPIRAAELTYECKDGTPQEIVDFIRDQFQPWERFILDQGVYARGWGCRQMELIYKKDPRTGRLVLDRPKALMPELTQALQDAHGNLVGLVNQGVTISDPRRFLWITYDGKGCNFYGRSRKENFKKPWLRQEAAYDLLEYSMNIQVRPFGYVSYPYGLKDADGNSLNDIMKANAARIASNLAAGQFGLIPDPFAPAAEEMIQKGIDPSKVMPYKIGWYDAKADGGEGFERMFKITDRGIVSGTLMPPRSLLEGPGTQADAGTHTDTGVLVNSSFLSEVCFTVNRGPIDTVLVQNFGEEYRGCVWWQPAPLVNTQLTFNNDLVKQVLGSQIGPVLLKRVVQLRDIFEKSGVKCADFDQEQLVEEAEKAAAEKRRVELKSQESEEDARAMSLSATDSALNTLVDTRNRLTDVERKRRKQFLLALLAFFGWQAESLTAVGTDAKNAADPRFVSRLKSILEYGMRQQAAALTPPLESVEEMAEYAGKIATRIETVAADLALKINATTAKNLEAAGGNADAVDAVLRRAVESRAVLIEDDATHIASVIASVAAATDETVWRTAEDDRVCTVCGPLDGVVAKAGEEFAPGIRLPVVDTHGNCRCQIVPLPKE